MRLFQILYSEAMPWNSESWDVVEAVMTTECPSYEKTFVNRFFVLVTYVPAGLGIWIFFSMFFHKTMSLFAVQPGFWLNVIWWLVANAVLPKAPRDDDMCYHDADYTRVSEQSIAIFYLTTFYSIHDYFHHTYDATPQKDRKRGMTRVFFVVGMVTGLVLTTYGLYHIKWHNGYQILTGALIGIINGTVFGLLFHLAILPYKESACMRAATRICGVSENGAFKIIDYAKVADQQHAERESRYVFPADARHVPAPRSAERESRAVFLAGAPNDIELRADVI